MFKILLEKEIPTVLGRGQELPLHTVRLALNLVCLRRVLYLLTSEDSERALNDVASAILSSAQYKES